MSKRSMSRALRGLLLLSGLLPLECISAADLFQNRILPLAKSPEHSSCTECHFSGVELRNYIQDSEQATFASLRDAGLIDTRHPEKSKLLQFIARRPEKPNELTEKVRRQELDAFTAWINSAVKDPELLKAKSGIRPANEVAPEVIRHARKDHVVSRFVDSIWSEIGRCQNCHSPDRNQHQIGRMKEEEVEAISWIVPGDPAATLQKLVDTGNIDLEHPDSSPVLTKPAVLVEHGGGPKFFPGSDTYRKFSAFLNDYAAIRANRYATPSELPPASDELVLLTEQQLRITNIPKAFAGKSLQVNLFAWNASNENWETNRCATAFSRVNGKDGIWQNQIQLVLSTQDVETPKKRKTLLLPEGRYKVEILIDTEGQTETDYLARLTDRNQQGVTEISGPWPPGYQPPRIIKFPESR